MTENIEPAVEAEKPTEDKTYTKEQVEQIVRQRLANVKAQPPADYEELKSKAEKFDEVEEANKSELQKLVERAEKAEGELASLKEAQARAEAVRSAANTYGVDAETLSRMTGDVESNAAFLKEKAAAQKPAYPQVTDNGELPPSKAKTLSEIDAISDPSERMAEYAKYYELNG